jgi:hypothetical protein
MTWGKILKGILFPKTKQTRGLCQCKGELFQGKIEYRGFCESAPLRDGHHTNFALYRCDNCGGFRGFPPDNLTLALEEGTKEFLIELGKSGIDITSYLEKIMRKEKIKVMLI